MTSELFINEVADIFEDAAKDYPGQPKKLIWHWLARKYGVTARRARAFLNGEVRQLTVEEYAQIKQADEDRRKAKAERLRRELETLDREIADYERDREAFRKNHPKLASLYAPSFPRMASRQADDEAKD